MIKYGLIEPVFGLDLGIDTDLIQRTQEELCNKIIKNRDDKIKESIKAAGYTFNNDQDLIELMKDQSHIISKPNETIKELYIDNKLICIWDEKYEFEYKDNKFTITYKFLSVK